MIKKEIGRRWRFSAICLSAALLLNACLMNDPVEEEASAAPSPPPAQNSPPAISGTPAQMVKVGVAYGFTPAASDPDSDPLSFSIQNRPNWASFDTGSGALTGIPLLGSEGTYSDIAITVTDGSMSATLPPFTITVEAATAPNMPPEISGTPPASVIVGNAYAFTPSASDPDGDPLTFSIQNRPSWAAFDPITGALSGTPQSGDEGIYAGIAITVSDPLVSASLPSFSITVAAANVAPVISGTPGPEATVGQLYVFTPTASDANGDTLTFTVANLPSWATFDSTNGELRGTPGAGDIGNYPNISITVSDGSLTDSLPPFGIDVVQSTLGSALLSWTAPTTNTDGSPLTDLAGFRIYYGNDPANLSNRIDINNPGVNSHTVDNLTTGTWYFESSAFNSAGVESVRSNRASKVIN